MASNVKQLVKLLPQQGELTAILVRPARREAMQSVDAAEIRVGEGIIGDRFCGRPDSKRQVTLFQEENLAVLASLLHREDVDPALLRRNLLVRGINLHALSGRRFQMGTVVLEGAAQCHPCSRMEAALGPGGFNAMRGIGGLCAKVVTPGVIRVGDSVVALCDDD